jgi:hypothetical protein
VRPKRIPSEKTAQVLKTALFQCEEKVKFSVRPGGDGVFEADYVGDEILNELKNGPFKHA